MTLISTTSATISIDDLRVRLDDPLTTVIDTRRLAAYNGWRVGDQPRGGHIPGAVALPTDWLGLLSSTDLDELLAYKGVTADQTIVVYGDDAEAVAVRLENRGLKAQTFEQWSDWVADPAYPLERLPRYEKLVHPDWLAELLDGAKPEAAPAGRFLVFHVNFGVPEEYEEGHIPGSLYLDTNWLEASEDWNRRSPEELEAVLASLGVTPDVTVILYGRDTVGNPNEKWPGRRAGQIAATRAAAILTYAGVEDVRLLDGGYDHWFIAGHPLEATVNTPEPVAGFGISIPAQPDVIVDIDDAKRILVDPTGAALVSVRTWKEHVGLVSGYNYIEATGRIAGDVWGNCGSDAYHMQHYRNVDNTMRPYPEIAANWADAGITPDKWVAFYCGTGWRASETWFYAHLMGWERIAVYDGGWFEWSQDPVNNPIEIGEPEDEAAA